MDAKRDKYAGREIDQICVLVVVLYINEFDNLFDFPEQDKLMLSYLPRSTTNAFFLCVCRCGVVVVA